MTICAIRVVWGAQCVAVDEWIATEVSVPFAAAHYKYVRTVVSIVKKPLAFRTDTTDHLQETYGKESRRNDRWQGTV